jgi:death-on-curing protein
MKSQFLTLDEVIDIHRDQIDRYGSTLGVRDAALPESALAALQSGLDD